jgi:hypothetical protein
MWRVNENLVKPPGEDAVLQSADSEESVGPCGSAADPSSPRKHARSAPIPSAFETTARIPNAVVGAVLTSSSWMVSKTIGTFGIVFFKTAAASMPFNLGIAISRMIKSGFSSFARSIPATPSRASSQTMYPCVSRQERSTGKKHSLSSTMRMRFGARCAGEACPQACVEMTCSAMVGKPTGDVGSAQYSKPCIHPILASCAAVSFGTVWSKRPRLTLKRRVLWLGRWHLAGNSTGALEQWLSKAI